MMSSSGSGRAARVRRRAERLRPAGRVRRNALRSASGGLLASSRCWSVGHSSLARARIGALSDRSIEAVQVRSAAPCMRGRCVTLLPCPGPERHPANGIPAFDERQLRDALAQFATGVTVVCARGARPALRGIHRQFVQFAVAVAAADRLEPVVPLEQPCGVRRGRALLGQRSVDEPGRARAPLLATPRRPVPECADPARLVGRAADRRLRRVVRVPPSRAASHRRSRAVRRRDRDRRARARPWPRLPARPLRIDRDAPAEATTRSE